MKKYIVISCNNNEDYVYFLPLVQWAWERIGWNVIFLTVDRWNDRDYQQLASRLVSPAFYFEPIEGVREATIAQVSRLYGAEAYISIVESIDKDDIVMLGDIDLLPLGDHWHPENDKVTVYNHDLTGRTEIPMCFVAAPKRLWADFMNYTGNPGYDIRRDLENYDNAKSDDFYKWWGCDQQILTDRLKKYGYDKITFIDRGHSDIHGYARGRVDRAPGGWRFDLLELIDAHCEQQVHHKQEKVDRLYALLRHVWPDSDFTWWREYTEQYRELTGHRG